MKKEPKEVKEGEKRGKEEGRRRRRRRRGGGKRRDKTKEEKQALHLFFFIYWTSLVSCSEEANILALLRYAYNNNSLFFENIRNKTNPYQTTKFFNLKAEGDFF
ncbi:hypothetical protein PoB_002763800 [Plakobranchus ocellatus]|uniref:Uncharacterized protein n=1 Tax=Plakobranchus ocellatus TaxID=259542 RepID=A0AAV4A1W1_9GAST|nr:hypothetical protein PoB_002763800 [Plakobranchus ocellatus]